MKKNILTIAVVLILIGLFSCNNYLDVNTNPNAPTSTVPDFVLSGAIVETARIQSQDVNAFSAYWSGYWAASGTYSQSGDVIRNYNLTNASGVVNTSWNTLYANASNYNLVEVNSKKLKGYDYFVAIAKIMKVYDFHTLVDIYNNIPYTNALKGFSNLAPAYDDGASVYASLAVQLDSAIYIIKNASNPNKVPASVDVMFSGDMTKWQQLANTMKLRLLLRQSQVVADQSAQVAKIIANGIGFLGTDALINPGYTKATGLQNPFWETNGLSVGDATGNRDYNRVSNFSLTFFKNNSDPRIDYFFRHPGAAAGVNADPTVTPTPAYKGIDFGQEPDTGIGSGVTSGFGTGVLGSPGQPVVFLSASESLFLQAEAVARGWMTSADPLDSIYKFAIRESFRYLGVKNYKSATNAYYTSYGALGVAFNGQLSKIITQKWAAMTDIDCMEAWCDIRRLGIVVPPVSVDPGRTAKTNPVRLLYPLSEVNNNTSAVNKQGTINQFTSRIFWDVN